LTEFQWGRKLRNVMTKLSDVTLSDEAVRFIAAEVAAGRFRSMDHALQAGVEALKERDETERDWLQYARQRFAEGRTAFARGEVLETTPDELMDGVEKELGLT
jgi:Arc/MetJ-type ribon-helix-helix transcriptional regulator